jgi:glycosyltransferase involved in cell wall biosynthesis
MEYIFWFAVVGSVYSYFLYPVILLLMPPRRVVAPPSPGELPSITLIITAHNEEGRIREKLQNTMQIDYPADKLEVIVASDASSDTTEEIVRGYAEQGIRLVRANERKGKEYAQWHAIQAARGDILVFSDVATRIPPDGVRLIAEKFTDPRVGAVSSEDRFISESGRVIGEGAYVKYEMWLRRLESRCNSLVGLSGSFFAARRKICLDWDISVPSDFNTALNSVRNGYVAITAPDVHGFYTDIKDERREYQRKLRTVIRGISAIFVKPQVLNPFQFGFFSWQIWGHKVMRWLVPWFLILTLLANLTLLDMHWIYRVCLGAQSLFYATVLAGFLFKPLRAIAVIKLPFFFVQVNIAILHATVAFMLGRRMTTWEPSRR